MSEKIQKLINPITSLGVIVFIIACLITPPVGLSDYTSYIGYSVSSVTATFIAYEKWLWKIIPWNRPPILMKHYSGIINYNFGGKRGQKPIDINIKQTWLSIDVKTKTDINSSVTIISTIVNEYSQYVLYYSYMTNPSAATQKNNPIQYGTCRMILEGDNSHIIGKYWTSSNTTGDIEWTAIK